MIYLFNNLQEPCLLKDEKSAWEEGQKRARTPTNVGGAIVKAGSSEAHFGRDEPPSQLQAADTEVESSDDGMDVDSRGGSYHSDEASVTARATTLWGGLP